VVVIKKKETPVAYVKPTAYPQAMPATPNATTVATKPVITKPSNIVVNENAAPVAEKKIDTVAMQAATKPAVVATETATATQVAEVKQAAVTDIKSDMVTQVATVVKPVAAEPVKAIAIKEAPAVAVPAAAEVVKKHPLLNCQLKKYPL